MKIICPKCGKEMRYNAEFDVEVPSDEPRIISQYLCDCEVEIIISYPND